DSRSTRHLILPRELGGTGTRAPAPPCLRPSATGLSDRPLRGRPTWPDRSRFCQSRCHGASSECRHLVPSSEGRHVLRVSVLGGTPRGIALLSDDALHCSMTVPFLASL